MPMELHWLEKRVILTIIKPGIGGMAAALTLGLRGHHVIVLESAPKVCVVEDLCYLKQG